MQPNTADAHNKDLTGRVETSGAGLNPLRDAIATYNVIISELRVYIKKLESENASLRARLAAKTDGEKV